MRCQSAHGWPVLSKKSSDLACMSRDFCLLAACVGQLAVWPFGGSLTIVCSMAVAIASALDKDMAGEPLLRGVSFKLERRDRMTLSGRNGSGKTTLLRMLAGQASIDGGELSIEKGARVTLHDQRPP